MMVLHQVEDLVRNFGKSWKNGHTNFVFKSHYILSVFLLSTFLIATSLYLIQHDYVNCVGTKGETEKLIDNYAYYFSTFTTVEDKDGMMNNGMTTHNYYMWVPVLFICQIFAFNWPYYSWQKHGGKILMKLSEDKSKEGMFARYIEQRFEHKLNDIWLSQLMLIEFQNILVCVFQWITTNYVFTGKFYRLGLDVPFWNEVFPIETKFSFKTYGPSATIQVKDYKCILRLNALYKYLFLIYWWWLAVLSTLSILNFVLRIALMSFRAKIWFWEKRMDTWRLTDRSWFMSLRYADWVFLKYLYTSVSWYKYRAVIRRLAKRHMRTLPGDDVPSESSAGMTTAMDIEEQEVEMRFRTLLNTIMYPDPMFTNQNDDEVRSDLSSGSIAAEDQKIIYPVPMQSRAGNHEENYRTAPGTQNMSDAVSTDREVVIHTFYPVEDETKATKNKPETDPLLGDVHYSGTGSSKSDDESEEVLLNSRRKTVQYRHKEKN